jgi:hypothetical protein
MAIRWSIETVLRVFNKQFTVVSLWIKIRTVIRCSLTPFFLDKTDILEPVYPHYIQMTWNVCSPARRPRHPRTSP